MRSLTDLLGVDPRYRPTLVRHTVAWLFWGAFAGGVTQQLGFVVRKIGGSPFLVSLVTTGPLLVTAFAVLYIPLLERFPAKRLVAAARTVAASLFVAAAACGTPGQLVAVALVAMTVFRIGEPFYGRLLDLMYPPATRGRLQSLPMFVSAAVTAAVSILAGWALRGGAAAYRWVFPAAGGAGVLGALLILTIPLRGRDAARRGASPLDALRDVWGDKRFLSWALVYSVVGMGYWFTAVSLPVYFASVLRVDYLANGVAQAVMMGVYCVSFLLWGRLLDRHKSLPVMAAGWTLVAAGTLATAAGGSYFWAIVGQVLSGFGYGGNDIAWFPVILEYAPRDLVDRYMGFSMCLFGLRALLGGFGSGLLMELFPAAGSRISLLVSIVLIVVGIGGMLALRLRAGTAPSERRRPS